MRHVTSFALFLVLLLALISFAAADTSCNVKASRPYLPASDFYEGGTARTSVFGDGTGSFSDSASVEIDCNADNALPAPVQKIVKARLSYTQSTMHFSGDCYYPRPETEIKYRVSAKILPENAQCVGAVDGSIVTAEGSGKKTPNITKKECGTLGAEACEGEQKCKEPYAYDGFGKCAACPDGTTYKGGKCVKQSEKKCSAPMILRDGVCVYEEREVCTSDDYVYDKELKKCVKKAGPVYGKPTCGEGYIYDDKKEACILQKQKDKEKGDLPILPGDDEETITITLSNKYSFIGVPFEEAELVENTCEESAAYTLDNEENRYSSASIASFVEDSDAYTGAGLLVKRSPEAEECSLTFKGSYADSQIIGLKKGWNLVAVQTKVFEKQKNIKSDCAFSSAFLSYNSKSKKFVRGKNMVPGKGYMIKVKKDCSLTAKGEEDLPRLPD